MKFFDLLIDEISVMMKNLPTKEFLFCKGIWKDEGYSRVILQRDTAFELDGTGFNLLTDKEIQEGITVIGYDLSDIYKSRKFARICLVQLESCEDEQETYKLIKKADYVKYHHFPEGYMIRTTSRSHKEAVRVAKSAIKAGIDFSRVGSLMIEKYKEIPSVKAVRVIYITADNADYKKLEDIAQKAGDITETLNHIMNSVIFDCDSCNLKPICDEVEGMKELHFKSAGIM